MRIIILLVLIVLPLEGLSQNVYRVAKATNNAILINRTTIVAPELSMWARWAISDKSNQILTSKVKKQIALEATIKQEVCFPVDVSGGYNYLKLVAREMKGCDGWENISRTRGYNGAHHIINKTVIDVICADIKANARLRGKEIHLDVNEVKNNAPAIFHPYHNRQGYAHIFHNPKEQIRLYYTIGVRGIIEDFFIRVNELNKAEGLPPYPEEFIEHTLKEAALWAKHYGLHWSL